MKKQPEITEQTRRNLLDAFWGLYAERGMARVAVKDVAVRAGYNRGTFYEYFRDLPACLNAIEEECLPTFEDFPPAPGSGLSLEESVEAFVRLYRKKARYWDVLLGDSGDPAFQRKLIESIKATVKASPAMSALGKREGREVDLLLEYVLSGMIGLMRYCFHGKGKGPEREVLASIYRIMEGDLAAKLRSLAP